jgi:hypothetical protein
MKSDTGLGKICILDFTADSIAARKEEWTSPVMVELVLDRFPPHCPLVTAVFSTQVPKVLLGGLETTLFPVEL